MQVEFLDRDLQTLTEGMVAVATSPAQPETRFPLTVRQLPYPYGSGAQGSEADSFVRLSFNNPEQAADLSIGQRMEVAILLENRNDVLWLPPAAPQTSEEVSEESSLSIAVAVPTCWHCCCPCLY